MNDDDDVIALK